MDEEEKDFENRKRMNVVFKTSGLSVDIVLSSTSLINFRKGKIYKVMYFNLIANHLLGMLLA